MALAERQFSIKKQGAFFWRTGLTREEVVEFSGTLSTSGEKWLVCPLGRADQAVALADFLNDPKIFGPGPYDDNYQSTASESVGLWSIFLAGLIAFNFLGLLAAAAIPPVAFLIIGVLAGAILAQIGLVATWGVFSAAAFTFRLTTTAAIGLVLFGAFGAGLLVVAGRDPEAPSAILFALLPCPLLFFCVQAPMWGARNWLQWNINESDELKGSYLEPTGIRDFFVATAAVAIGLTLIRIAPLLFPQEAAAEGVIFFLLAVCIAAPFGSLLGVAPFVVIVLGFEDEKNLFAALLAYSACILLGLICLTAITMGFAVEALAGVTMTVSYVGVTGIGLGLARRAGFRLRFSKEGLTKTGPSTTPVAQASSPR